MMAEGDFVAAELLRGKVQRTPAEPGTEGTGVLLLPVFKNDGADLGTAHLIGDAVPGKQLFQRAVVHRLMIELRVQRDRLHLEVEAEILLQPGKADGQSHTVLAAGNAHQHPVARDEHPVILHRFPHPTAQALHVHLVWHGNALLFTISYIV